MRDLTELNRLEEYLKTNRIPYERADQDDEPLYPEVMFERHQLIVYDERGNRLWDAICHKGSYGAEAGLLEIMGNIVNEETVGDTVEGWLTAEDVIKRVEQRKEKK